MNKKEWKHAWGRYRDLRKNAPEWYPGNDHARVAAQVYENRTTIENNNQRLIDNNQSLVMLREEARNEKMRARILGQSFNNNDKEKALKKHPELAPIYDVEKQAAKFAEEKLGKDSPQKTSFISKIVARGIDKISKGERVIVQREQSLENER